jgi:hypothetical protein
MNKALLRIQKGVSGSLKGGGATKPTEMWLAVLNDGLSIRLRPQCQGPVRAYDFVEARTYDARKFPDPHDRPTRLAEVPALDCRAIYRTRATCADQSDVDSEFIAGTMGGAQAGRNTASGFRGSNS